MKERDKEGVSQWRSLPPCRLTEHNVFFSIFILQACCLLFVGEQSFYCQGFLVTLGRKFVSRIHFVLNKRCEGAIPSLYFWLFFNESDCDCVFMVQICSILGNMDTTGLLCLVLVVLGLTESQGSAQRIINVAVGDTLVLELDPRPPRIKVVVWKHGLNLLAELIYDEFAYYGSFKGHTKLEENGSLTVSNIKLEEGGEYRVEVNNVIQDLHYNVKVYEVLTRPLIRVTPLTCGTYPITNCTLVCKVEPEPSTPVSYEWEQEGEVSKISGKELTINDATKAANFMCLAKNPMSEQASESTKNPFLRESKASWLELGLRFTAAFVVLLLGLAGLVHYLKKKPGTSERNPSAVI